MLKKAFLFVCILFLTSIADAKAIENNSELKAIISQIEQSWKDIDTFTADFSMNLYRGDINLAEVEGKYYFKRTIFLVLVNSTVSSS